MSDQFDSFFLGDEVKKRINGMEKKKLLKLDNERENYWKVASDLEKERNKLRNNLQPINKKELQRLKDERNALLEIKTEEARQIKEDRKKIRNDFSLKTKSLRVQRLEQLKSNPNLSKNQIEKNITWKNCQKFGMEFNDYYGHLVKKYRNNPK